ncbi:MAG: ATP-dependent DNA helicase [Polaromonas sp.]|uniref:ATP-dependent DNA helicase n=1 Tax=Polaromonas sp. TaxID=1869339 RepID=UPI002731C966|nr:ATP-dependent DNA helicase [Polaromonas sp.]MDP2450281.1 ATP-dependent DNA helicase [Polaromonas sp.]MDP3249446.1 ATP-dependent DNA helicase [Polaromonas sp.]MDP3753905.1 ATP-dependent DNA helicase [Polaromonas sp.]
MTTAIDKDKPYVVAVRALCEFTAKLGDLDVRFTPSPSALEGMAGHRMVAMRRPAHYQTEVSLSGVYKDLLVRGRADGYDPELGQLEEVKTFRGDLEAMRANHRHLHWAQLKVYGHLLCQKEGLSQVKLALVYFDIATQDETLLTEAFSAAQLEVFFEEQCDHFLDWARQEMVHRAARNEALQTLAFPHERFRPGQRDLAEAVYKSASSGRCLMAQAPTGIGKTVGTLFPLLKACPTQQLDKVFFLAAKTPGRQLALDAVARIQRSAPALPLRVLELVAKGKACEHPDKACHGDACPLAKGFYDRLPAARRAAVAMAGPLDKGALREVALAHGVCPYYLGQDLLHWSDVVIGDYNYYFDINAMLYAQTLANQWRVSVLVDEAHNLVERARKMYSAELDTARLALARRGAPVAIKRVLDRLQRSWYELHQDQAEAYQVYDEVPQAFRGALQQTASAILDHLADHPAGIDGRLQDFFFEVLHFSRMAELLDTHSLFDITDAGHSGGGAVLCLRNVVPAGFLSQRFAAARSAALFSATLSPAHYYSDMLGLPEDTAWIDVASPFRAEQLSVQVVDDVSTRFQHRGHSLSPMVDLMARQYAAAPGNYLSFVSSFDYLQQLADLFKARYPAIPVWEQSRGMEESAKRGFLERFTPASRGIGFAVLGGAFAEGIDLPGKRLIGAFVATLGLPQINPVNEQIKQRMEASFGKGYDYTYLYPGLQKVVQAAGRVIRTESDRGVVFLIDDRYAQAQVRELFPGWWKVERLQARLPRGAAGAAASAKRQGLPSVDVV